MPSIRENWYSDEDMTMIANLEFAKLGDMGFTFRTEMFVRKLVEWEWKYERATLFAMGDFDKANGWFDEAHTILADPAGSPWRQMVTPNDELNAALEQAMMEAGDVPEIDFATGEEVQ